MHRVNKTLPMLQSHEAAHQIGQAINALTPRSDQQLISPYGIISETTIKVTARIAN